MDLKLSLDEQNFRDEIVRFVDRAFPVAVRENPSAVDEKRWHQAVANQGWTAVEWSAEFGGPGWKPIEIYLWYTVTLKANCPPADYCGLHVVGPLLQQFGDPVYHSLHLENIISHTQTWGNAVFLDGSSIVFHTNVDENYLLQGETPCIATSPKIDWVLLLTNTGNARSLFLVDLNLMGMNLVHATGTTNIFRLTLDQVLVPASCLLGEEGKGLEYLISLMTSFQTVSIVVHLQVALSNLKKVIRQYGLDSDMEDQLADLEIELDALEVMGLRSTLSGYAAKMPIVTIRGHSLARKISDSFRDALGYYALPDEHAVAGSNEPPMSLADFKLKSWHTEYLPGCPTGFRQDLVAKTLLGL
ncbi:MAG: acyl-CoA dehydrogenase family protein [Gammaproteobacteria bacterium]|nr:acyl-CoA dehydrogenase family protein [Gammaproteobacteria bacterium]